MAQVLTPTADITNPANWNGTYADIDEASASDSDFGYCDDKANDTYEFRFQNTGITDPVSAINHTFRCRVSKTDGGVPNNNSGSTSTLQILLIQGTTTIATIRATSAVTTWEDVSYTLTSGEANSITNYNDLRIRLIYVGGSGAPNNRRGVAISWSDGEVPDAAVPRQRYIFIG